MKIAIHAKSASVPRLALRPFSYRLARAKRATRETEKARGRNFFLGFFLVRQVVSACNCMITQEHFKLLAVSNRWLTPGFTRQLLTYQN